MSAMPSPVTLEIQEAKVKGLTFKSMHWIEELGRLPTGQLEFMSTEFDPEPGKLIGKLAIIGLLKPDLSRRFLTGYISEVQYGGAMRDFFVYRVMLRSSLWILSLGSYCAVFQEITTPAIMKAILALQDRIVPDFSGLKNDYDVRKREFCVQYRESSFAFISRLMEQDAIYYMATHSETGHTIRFLDTLSSHTPPDKDLDLFHVGVRGERAAEPDQIFDWTVLDRATPTSSKLVDYNFLTPSDYLFSKFDAPDTSHKSLGMSFYDYPGGYATQSNGDGYAEVRGEEFFTNRTTYTGTSNSHQLAAGMAIKVMDAGPPVSMLLTSVTLELAMDGLEQTSKRASTPEFRFECRFKGQPTDRVFRPLSITPRARVYGPQTAVVVGKKDQGEEIHTDEYGRVKVQFRWDRDSVLVPRAERESQMGWPDGLSSCFIRVAQVWAGKSFGAVFVPRVDHEVIVEFLEGDPDRPIITGSVYHKENPPPWKPKEFPTRSGLVTRSSTGGSLGNASSIVIEDKKGSEFFALHAEKDFSTSVENDASLSVGHDLGESVQHNRRTGIDNHDSLTVKKGRHVSIVDSGDTYSAAPFRVGTITGSDYLTTTADRVANIGGGDYRKVDGLELTTVTGVVVHTFLSDFGNQISGDVVLSAGGAYSSTIGGDYMLTGANLHFKTPGKVNFNALEFNRTVFEANDTFLGSNTGTYIGAASDTTIAGSRSTFIGTKNDLELSIAIATSIGMSVESKISVGMDIAVGPRIQWSALQMDDSPLDLTSRAVLIEKAGMHLMLSGGPGGGGGPSAGPGMMADLAGSFGAAAAIVAAYGNAVQAAADVTAFPDVDGGAVAMAMLGTVLGANATAQFSKDSSKDPKRFGADKVAGPTSAKAAAASQAAANAAQTPSQLAPVDPTDPALKH